MEVRKIMSTMSYLQPVRSKTLFSSFVLLSSLCHSCSGESLCWDCLCRSLTPRNSFMLQITCTCCSSLKHSLPAALQITGSFCCIFCYGPLNKAWRFYTATMYVLEITAISVGQVVSWYLSLWNKKKLSEVHQGAKLWKSHILSRQETLWQEQQLFQRRSID